ncbi:MAG: hypothetical protein AB1331_01420 [Bacillota bacterium]
MHPARFFYWGLISAAAADLTFVVGEYLKLGYRGGFLLFTANCLSSRGHLGLFALFWLLAITALYGAAALRRIHPLLASLLGAMIGLATIGSLALGQLAAGTSPLQVISDGLSFLAGSTAGPALGACLMMGEHRHSRH